MVSPGYLVEDGTVATYDEALQLLNFRLKLRDCEAGVVARPGSDVMLGLQLIRARALEVVDLPTDLGDLFEAPDELALR
jgi:hypothetical protein